MPTNSRDGLLAAERIRAEHPDGLLPTADDHRRVLAALMYLKYAAGPPER